MNKLLTGAILMTLAFLAEATPPADYGAHEPPAADVHCHFITPGYLALLEKHGARMDELYPIPAWSPEALAKFLDEAGIGLAVLTSVAPQPHFGDAAESAAACRAMNDEAARLAASDPARIKWCATLPLPSVKESVAEAVRALDELGAAGVKLPTNARGLYLGDESLDPLMAALDARGAVAILHPHRPEPFDAKLAEGLPLAMYEYPAETTRALARLFARNVPARYPNVKFVVPHAGAFLPLALPRMKAVHPISARRASPARSTGTRTCAPSGSTSRARRPRRASGDCSPSQRPTASSTAPTSPTPRPLRSRPASSSCARISPPTRSSPRTRRPSSAGMHGGSLNLTQRPQRAQSTLPGGARRVCRHRNLQTCDRRLPTRTSPQPLP